MVNRGLNKIREQTTSIMSYGLLMLLLLTPHFSSGSNSSVTPKEVNDTTPGIILIVSSYNPDTKRMNSFISEFENKILDKQVPYQILIEDLGCKGISESLIWQESLDKILERYFAQNLKAVVLLGQEAWATFLSRDEFPQDIPFFGCFASINGVYLPKSIPPASDWSPESIDMVKRAQNLGVSGGTLNQYDAIKNVELIRSIYPQVEHIAFISDNTYGGIAIQALVKKEMKQYADLDLILIDGRNGEVEASQSISRLPSNSVLLIGTWRVGKDGQYLMQQSLHHILQSNQMLPVFTMTGSGLGTVALGGYIPKYNSGAGYIADQIADRYHNRSDHVQFFPIEGQYRFDRQKLREFDIAEYRLPSGSVIDDSMEAQLAQYRSYIITLIVVFVILAFCFVILYLLYLHNKRLKKVLQKREKELIAAKEDAEEADMLKSAFLANMSHEIRTPLNAIVGFSALLGDKLSDEERQEYNEIVTTNSSLLLTLIGDILEISRLETGKVSLTYEKIDLFAICQQVIHTTAHSRNAQVKCTLKTSISPYWLETDVQRLSQVLINLLSNANKFTSNGQITLSYEVQQDEGLVIFSVSDTGCGIPTEMQNKVFNRFEKLNEFKQGTGLGLAICKQIIQRFGGNIWLDPNYTEGARFVFTHPITPKPDHNN